MRAQCDNVAAKLVKLDNMNDMNTALTANRSAWWRQKHSTVYPRMGLFAAGSNLLGTVTPIHVSELPKKNAISAKMLALLRLVIWLSHWASEVVSITKGRQFHSEKEKEGKGFRDKDIQRHSKHQSFCTSRMP